MERATTSATGAALIAVLDRQGRLYTRMLDLAEQQRLALIEGDTAVLPALAREMEGLTTVLDQLEDERRTYTVTLAGADMSLSELMPCVEAPQRVRLAALRDELTATLSRLRMLNEGNAALVYHALTHVGEWSRQLRGLLPNTYRPDGRSTALPLLGRAWSA
jgi:flagellar biosynthesis/type III secretory pathway chaperone